MRTLVCLTLIVALMLMHIHAYSSQSSMMTAGKRSVKLPPSAPPPGGYMLHVMFLYVCYS